MIENFNRTDRKKDLQILACIIMGFLFVAWLCSPPGNKIAQVCFYGNNTRFLIAKLTKSTQELDEWIFHRNNAIYLARMERKSASLTEIDKSVMTVPNYVSDSELAKLYSDRGDIRLFWGEYKSALDDYLRLENPGILDCFKIALLYKQIGNNRYALSYCNRILNIDPNAYIGYACAADIYATAGHYNASVKIYDLLIDKAKNRAQYYADRAAYKKKCGDIEGYKSDLKKAKELSPMLNTDFSIIEDTLNPKQLSLTIM